MGLSSFTLLCLMQSDFTRHQVAEKRPSTALPSPLVVATYFHVRLTPQDFGRLVPERF